MGGAPTSRAAFLGTLFILMSGVCWASYTIVLKIAVDLGLSEIEINSIRLIVGAALIGVFLLVRGRFSFRISFKYLLLLLVLGALDYGLGGVLYVGSLRYIDASLAFLLVYTFPAFVVVVSIILGREKPTLPLFLAVVLTFVGVALVLEVGAAVEGEQWIGVIFVILSVLIFVAFVMICEGLMDRLSSSQITFLTLGAGGLSMLAFIPVVGVRAEMLFEPRNLAVLLFLAVIGTAFSMILFFMGIRRIGAARASIITTAEPVFVVLMAWLLLGETLSLLQMAGVALQLSGVLLVQLRAPHPEPGP
ncbi:MAG TPA: DMT family transporter [Acidobacteriota bacterium]|nr:DMT family transporter [Acidobacteriota bacterium]